MKIFKIFLVSFIMFSCKDNNPYLGIKIGETKNKYPYKDLKYKLQLPDTVIKDKLYNISLTFESDFDKIIDSYLVDGALNDTTKTRVITFYQFYPLKSPLKDSDELVLKDSIFVTNKKFNINNITFNKTGEYVFCGLIEDEIMYNYYNKVGVRDSVFFDRRKQQVFKKVIVID